MTTTYNTALVRYQGGHVYVNRSGSARQRELYIEMGGVVHRESAIAIADRVLGLYRTARVSNAITGQVRNLEQVPGIGYSLGDMVDGQMLRSFTASLVGDGLVTVVPTLDDNVQMRLDAINRQLQRAGSGMRSEYASPNIVQGDRGDGTSTTPPEFSQSGSVTVASSEPWRAPRPFWVAWLDVLVNNPGLAPTRVALQRRRPGAWVTEKVCTVAAFQDRGLVVVNTGWKAGERLRLRTIEAGGASDLTASLRGTMA